jgi:acetyltransferase-like isoleucine patch superfamily enzyme
MRGAVSRVSPLARGAEQRLRSRASALRQARRSPNNAEGSVACQEQAQLHIADGTLVMGTMSYYAPHVVTYPGVTGRVIVGNFASVAADADFHLGGLRRTERVSQHPLRAQLGLPGADADDLMYGDGDIVVGGDTWVTTGCAVMSGVTIGDGAVVGTKAVVAQDVRPYAIVVGNPAREVGRRFGDEQIDALLRIRWWDWPVDDVKRHVALLCSPDVDAFIARFDDRAAGG